jgi:(2Fe-2S) ferredoxin
LARLAKDSKKVSERAPNELVGERPAATPEITGQIFERHVFVCTGGDWCATIDGDGLGVHAQLKKLVKEEPSLKGRVRVNHSGCLDQCGYGPVLVVYPENVWYWGVQPEDVEELVREHLVGGKPVERLLYRNRPGKNKLLRDEQRRPIGRPERQEQTGLVEREREEPRASSPTERQPGTSTAPAACRQRAR